MSEAEQTHEMGTAPTQAVAGPGAGVVEVEEDLLVEEVSIDGMCGVY